MPSADKTDNNTLPDSDREKEKDSERDRSGDRERSSKSKSSSSKAKDLSHVPCKFYKVGSCTAGSSCPFSHSLSEPGGQKDVCAWFVKGNCKFGHKCALAHVLPGQSMAMDRKNKKAAQAAAGGGSKDREGSKGGRTKRDTSSGGPTRNPLLAGGAGAPSRSLQPPGIGRPPIAMPLKATISPSAPAPPLQDTDFASFGALDESNKLPTAPAHGKQSSSVNQSLTEPAVVPQADSSATMNPSDEKPSISKPPSPVTLPVSTPSAPRRGISHNAESPSIDFGPIGSPPRSVTSNGSNPISRVNGFSPGTSPAVSSPAGFASTSPFSAPGTQSVFLTGTHMGGNGGEMDFKARSGLAASLGAMATGNRPWKTEFKPIPTSGRADDSRVDEEYGYDYGMLASGSGISAGAVRIGGRLGAGVGSMRAGDVDIAVQDEDLEDFLPSSLTDLLTPEERNRRMSRTNSGQQNVIGATLGMGIGGNDRNDNGIGMEAGLGGGSGGHRYSRSVPAPSLLGDIRSIWSDNTVNSNVGLPSSPGLSGQGHLGLGSGTPSSYKSTSQSFGAFDLSEDFSQHSPSHSLLSPSNASAAFLPGLHHHYLTSKTKGQLQRGSGMGTRGTNQLYPPNGNGGMAGYASGLSQQPSQFQSFVRPNPFDLTTNSAYNGSNINPISNTIASNDLYFPVANGPSVRPIPNYNANADPMGMGGMLSPSARALQSHAPGQSLPQGLAAGYSRIHALPSGFGVSGSPSPVASGFTSTPGASAFGNISQNEGLSDWAAASPPSVGNNPQSRSQTQTGVSPTPTTTGTGLETMFSRLSYSAAASRAPSSTSNSTPASSVAAPPIARNVSGGRQWQGTGNVGPLSPLSGPVVSGDDDDDDLFSMDG